MELRSEAARGAPGAEVVEPCTLVIFGGSGDLAKRKLLPALYNLTVDGLLPRDVAIVGIGRKEMNDESFRSFAREGVEKYSRRSLDEERWQLFQRSIFYHRGGLKDAASFEELKKRLDGIEADHGLPGNRIYYLSVPPSLIATAVGGLGDAGLARPNPDSGFSRVSGAGGGSSFDGRRFDGRNVEMNVLHRYRELHQEERALLEKALADEEVRELADRIWSIPFGSS